MTAVEFVVYVHPRGGRPREVGRTTTHTIPSTWDVDGLTFHFATADLSARTLTFTDIVPQVVAS